MIILPRQIAGNPWRTRPVRVRALLLAMLLLPLAAVDASALTMG
jgi:hypothetical protein